MDLRSVLPAVSTRWSRGPPAPGAAFARGRACNLLSRAARLRIPIMHAFPGSIRLVLSFLLSAAAANGLEFGVATCDITPDVNAYKVPMAGYGARKGKPSTGVHDPLHAKVLLFRDGKKL